MADPAHVFISYSSKDADLVDRLKAALARAGVDVWLDHEQLMAGTPDWRAAVVKGIEQATDVVYAASLDAAESIYVGHELAIARDEGKRVLPFWVRGEKWSRCAPMGYYHAQYIDGRDVAYAAGLAKLLDTLGIASVASATPTPTAPASPPLASDPPRRVPVHIPGHYAPAAPASVPQQSQPPIASPQNRSKEALFAALKAGLAASDAQHPPVPVPGWLVGLGFRGVNQKGTPAIVPPLVSVDAGPFLMGSDKKRDKGAYGYETPQHQVELAAFQIGKYPVTVAEYAYAVGAGAVYKPPDWQTQLQHPDHPVVSVPWRDTSNYVAWLRDVTGEAGWRLPSEAQWEKAARWDVARGVSRIYPWGDRFDQNRCNTRESGIGTTSPVGSYPASDRRRSGASPWGAEEMAGTVREWTSSLFNPYPYTESDGREDQNSTATRALRGGSWFLIAGNARSAYRDFLPGFESDDVGFRLAAGTLVHST